MYTLNIFKENNINYSWETILVGRKLELLLPEEVSKYAVEYLLINPNCVNSNVTELAYGAPERDIDVMLEKALKSLEINIQKDGPSWNLEKRKWRYCILKTLANKYYNDPEKFLHAYDLVWADFGHPSDMDNHLSFFVKDDEGDFKFDNLEEYFKYRMNRIINTIVNEEKIKIEKQDTNWPSSYNYPPENYNK